VRHVRRDGFDHLKKLDKEGHVGKDDIKRNEDQVQKATDQAITDIDQALAQKEKEVLQV
jgi:ribosome recycling factor